MGVTVTVQCMMQLGLLLSCDNILKFNWYCQLSGSGSTSLNSWKFPGRFSYGLGMRLQPIRNTRGLTPYEQHPTPQLVLHSIYPLWSIIPQRPHKYQMYKEADNLFIAEINNSSVVYLKMTCVWGVCVWFPNKRM